MEALLSFETSVNLYQITWSHSPENSNLFRLLRRLFFHVTLTRPAFPGIYIICSSILVTHGKKDKTITMNKEFIESFNVMLGKETNKHR
jgi:hypothetical protein